VTEAQSAPVASRPASLFIPRRLDLLRSPIFTERLVIEPFDTGSAARFYQAVQESRQTLLPWLPWVPYNEDLAGCRRYAQACVHDWEQGTALRFTLRRRDRAELIGVISLESITRLHRGCDLGYWLHQEWTGKGLMLEALQTMIPYAFDTLGFHRIRAAAATDNLRSRRVIENLGFENEGVAREAERVQGRWVTHSLYALLATDASRISKQTQG
jgi:ribosomal-protein-serine acetyltransferase